MALPWNGAPVLGPSHDNFVWAVPKHFGHASGDVRPRSGEGADDRPVMFLRNARTRVRSDRRRRFAIRTEGVIASTESYQPGGSDLALARVVHDCIFRAHGHTSTVCWRVVAPKPGGTTEWRLRIAVILIVALSSLYIRNRSAA